MFSSFDFPSDRSNLQLDLPHGLNRDWFEDVGLIIWLHLETSENIK